MERKALLNVGGRSILTSTIETLRSIDQINRIVVVGSDQILDNARASGIDGYVSPGKSAPDNILRGFQWLQQQSERPTNRVLVVTADMPFLTSSSLMAFLDSCPDDADLALPIIKKEDFNREYPEYEAIYVRLKDGEITPGCAYLLRSDLIPALHQRLESLFSARKSQIRSAIIAGPEIALRFITRNLAVSHIVHRVESLLNCRAFPVLGSAPELAFDIDNQSDYEYACRLVQYPPGEAI